MKRIWKHRYQIIEKLGKGGSGQVYKVWDIHLEKEWAMKELEGMIKDTYWYSGEEGQENVNEFEVLKKIAHPRFPRIVDAFIEDGKRFLVMDYVHGITLEEIVEKGALEEKKILSVGIQIAEAIEYLHGFQPALLYLDLKPANIMVEENGQIKLIDLGSVRVKGKGGKISGTFGFASPEQVQLQKEGIHLKEQSDIFSFGMVLFAMATGNIRKLPVMETGRRHGFLVRKYNPLISRILEQIIEKSTRGRSEKRYGSIRDVRRELEICEKNYSGINKLWFVGGRKKMNISFWEQVWFSIRTGMLMYGKRGEEWHQEKSIFCTEGKKSIYIAGKLALLLIVGCFWPMIDTVASEKTSEQYQERKSLDVVIRDQSMRKVLVKRGCSYETGDSLFFEIPWEEITGDECEITIVCKDSNEEEMGYQIKCLKK